MALEEVNVLDLGSEAASACVLYLSELTAGLTSMRLSEAFTESKMCLRLRPLALT